MPLYMEMSQNINKTIRHLQFHKGVNLNSVNSINESDSLTVSVTSDKFGGQS